MCTKMICATAVLVLLAFPTMTYAILWDFNTEGDTEGWLAYGRAFGGGGNLGDLRAEDGVLKILKVQISEAREAPPYAVILSPILNVDTELLDRIRVRVRCPEGQFVVRLGLTWRTSEAPTSMGPGIFEKYSFHWPEWIALSPEWERIEWGRLNEQQTWTGQLVQFELYFDFTPPGWPAQAEYKHELAPSQIWIDYIELTGIGEKGLEEPIPIHEDTTGGMWFGQSDALLSSYRPGSLWIGDMNGDDYLDLVTCGGGTMGTPGRLTVWLNSGGRTFAEQTYSVDMMAYRLCGGDVDGDGDRDVVVGDFEGARVGVFLNLGDGTLSQPVYYPVGVGPTYIWVGDLEGDGQVDLMVSNSGTYSEAGNTLSVLKNIGDGTFTDAGDYEVGDHPYEIWGGDVDDDGDIDVAVACAGPSEGEHRSDRDYIYVWRNDGGILVDREAYPVGIGCYNVLGGDLDGDGKADLAVAGAEDTVYVLMNTGDGMFRDAQSYAVRGRGLCGADFDLDGDIDLAMGNWPDAKVYVLENRGDGTFRMEGAYRVAAAPMGDVEVGDLDRDGHLDVVGVSPPERMLFVLWNGMGDRITIIEGIEAIRTPPMALLYVNYPNPFNAMTLIPFDLAFSGRVRLSVYDVLGRKVRTLVEGPMSPGHYTIPWDGRDDAGQPVASGWYVVRLQADTFSDTKTMILIK